MTLKLMRLKNSFIIESHSMLTLFKKGEIVMAQVPDTDTEDVTIITENRKITIPRAAYSQYYVSYEVDTGDIFSSIDEYNRQLKAYKERCEIIMMGQISLIS
jgi:hypothetical protein